MARWDGTTVVTTPRLLLGTYRRDDLPAFAALNADPLVYEQLGGEPLSPEHSNDIAEWAEECFEKDALGLLAVRRRDDGQFLGMCGLHHQESFPDDVEIAWRFASQHWGHGYATEAARGWLGYGFTRLRLPRIISVTDLDNARSIALMKRLGMSFVENTEIVDDGMTFDGVLYAITSDQWADQQASG